MNNESDVVKVVNDVSTIVEKTIKLYKKNQRISKKEKEEFQIKMEEHLKAVRRVVKAEMERRTIEFYIGESKKLLQYIESQNFSGSELEFAMQMLEQYRKNLMNSAKNFGKIE